MTPSERLNEVADMFREIVERKLPEVSYFLVTVIPLEDKTHYHTTLTNIVHEDLVDYMEAVLRSIKSGAHSPQRQSDHQREPGLRPSEIAEGEARQIPG